MSSSPKRSSPANTWSHPRVQRTIAILSVALLLVTILGTHALSAQDADTRVITIGESNTPEQREQLLEVFGADENDEVITVTLADTVEAMDGIYDLTGIETAYSSTALTCRELGDGLDVTTRNIQLVTPGLYAMALVTAGIGDAELIVAAPDGLTAVQGQTALAGVFQTWDIAPCESGDTNPARQELALRQLTQTAEIGILVGSVPAATALVLEVQRILVIDEIEGEEAITVLLTEQEAAFGFLVPEPQRADLITLMTDLAAAEIEWSTFAEGWEIENSNPDAAGNPTEIRMTGTGAGIRNAQLTATAEAGGAMTQTAEAGIGLTATANARIAKTETAEAGAILTLTAEAGTRQTATAAARQTEEALAAQQTADAQATIDAMAALTATAAAIPTATPTAMALSGLVVTNDGGSLTIQPAGTAGALTYPVAPGAAVNRDGTPVALGVVAAGDEVEVTLEGGERSITVLSATAPVVEASSPFGALAGVLLLLGLLGIGGWFVLSRRKVNEPFILVRTAS